MNILIADDSRFDIAIVEELIKSSGIECFIMKAGSGEEAIEIINSKEIDILLLNIIMPKLSGIDTLEIIREKNKNIMILMFTSLTDKKYMEKSFELGANDYINMPIEPIEFTSRLKAAIKMREYQNTLLNSCINLKKYFDKLKGVDIKAKEAQLEAKNEALGILGIVTDITEQKKIEEELKSTQLKMEALLESGPQCIVILNSEFKIQTFNKNAAKLAKEIYNISLKEGDYVSKFLNYDLYEKLKKNLNKALNGDEIKSEQKLTDNKDEELWLEVYYNSISYKTQDEKLVCITCTPITDRKVANEKIKQLSLAIENSPSSVLITDIKGKIEYANPKFSELTGYSLEEIKGKNVNVIKSGYHEDEYYRELWRNILLGNEWRGEFYNKRKDGSKYWEYTSIAPLKNDKGDIINFISVREDITQRKCMEEELRKSNEELKDTINKLKITQSQLIQQEKLAGIGQLAAGVAHEINNPLGFISSNFSTLKKYTEKLKASINDYRGAIDKIQIKDINLIESELKKFKELDKNKEIEYIVTDLDDLFNESEEGIGRVISIVRGLKWFAHEGQSNEFNMYDLNLGIKNTLIVTKNETKYIADVIEEYDEELPLIEASGQKINQVLLNIIVNSVYAIKEKESDKFGVINIKTYRNDEFVFCEIKDNGTGIKEEFINKVFEPFFTTKPIGKGTGLGLNISYDIIVNVHKGSIECKNNEDGGACFIIKLPIKQLIKS
ncbi:PAS domain S-box protein [Clostridium sp. C2-6-12]|uniref:PAS domain S-box protein n=1 Tax=Clostridium sp. C2-6-12 TaxID=2698832 RepID=UPI00136F1CEA|nr:PAS domain S-box protein [Clostridium sp. C2-6-12]